MLTASAYDRSGKQFLSAHVGSSRDSAAQMIRTRRIEEYLTHLATFFSESSGLKVLDAGCGPGDYTLAMAQRGWEATGVDASREMVEIARRRAQDKVHGESLIYEQRDFRQLPKSWNSRFDAVICMTAFQHVPSDGGAALEVIRSFRRVLRQGGILRVDAQIGRGRGFDPDLRYINGYSSLNDVQQLLEAGGFETLLCHEWHLPSGENSFRRAVDLRFAEFWARRR